MALDYAHERFSRAVHDLATGADHIHNRLLTVFRAHLVHIRPDHDLPDADLRDRYVDLLGRATARQPVENEGPLGATLGTMSDTECVELAEEIFELAGDIRKLHDQPKN